MTMAKPPGIHQIKRSDAHPRMCIVGVPGSGKTRLVGTSPGGLIIRPPMDHTESLKTAKVTTDCEEWEVDSWSEMDEALDYMQHEGYKTYQWVWLDSGSLMEEALLDDVFSDAVARKPTRAEYGPDKAEYGVNMYRLGQWLRHMTAVPINFGVTAHPMFYYDPIREEEIIVPAITGKKMPERLCGYMNVVGQLKVEIREIKGKERVFRVLYTDSRGQYYAKDQFDAFGGRVIEPTVPKLMELIEEARGRAPSPAPTKRAVKKKRLVRKR